MLNRASVVAKRTGAIPDTQATAPSDLLMRKYQGIAGIVRSVRWVDVRKVGDYIKHVEQITRSLEWPKNKKTSLVEAFLLTVRLPVIVHGIFSTSLVINSWRYLSLHFVFHKGLV